MAECKPCCRRGSIDDPAGAGVSRKRDQGGVLQRLQLDFLGAREPVPQRQHDIKGLCAKALRCEWLRHVRDISESKIRQAAVNVILDVALNAFSEMDLNADFQIAEKARRERSKLLSCLGYQHLACAA